MKLVFWQFLCTFSGLTERETYFKTFDYHTYEGDKCKDNRNELLKDYIEGENPCDYHGEDYLWCWHAHNSDWGYCSVKPGLLYQF